jgi:hypothetical protein
MCAINRLSIYILLFILINLCTLTYHLLAAIDGGLAAARSNHTPLNVVSTLLSIGLTILGYGKILFLLAEHLYWNFPAG